MTRDELIQQLNEVQAKLDAIRVESAAIASPRQRGMLWGAGADIRAVVRMLEMEDEINE